MILGKHFQCIAFSRTEVENRIKRNHTMLKNKTKTHACIFIYINYNNNYNYYNTYSNNNM